MATAPFAFGVSALTNANNQVNGNQNVTGNSTVAGNSAVSGNLAVTGDTVMTGDLNVDNTAVAGNLAVTGSLTARRTVLQLASAGSGNAMSLTAPVAELTSANSGSVVMVPVVADGNQIINLPACSAATLGMNFKFLVYTAANSLGNNAVITPSTGNSDTMFGEYYDAADNAALAVQTASASMSILAAALDGNYVECTQVAANGANCWHVSTSSSTAISFLAA